MRRVRPLAALGSVKGVRPVATIARLGAANRVEAEALAAYAQILGDERRRAARERQREAGDRVKAAHRLGTAPAPADLYAAGMAIPPRFPHH